MQAISGLKPAWTTRIRLNWQSMREYSRVLPRCAKRKHEASGEPPEACESGRRMHLSKNDLKVHKKAKPKSYHAFLVWSCMTSPTWNRYLAALNSRSYFVCLTTVDSPKPLSTPRKKAACRHRDRPTRLFRAAGQLYRVAVELPIHVAVSSYPAPANPRPEGFAQ